MNKIKFITPTQIKLTKNNKSIILNKINYTNEYTSWYTINNNNYA